MDTSDQRLAILAITLGGVTVRAWHLGNQKRGVALLGVFTGLCGVGTAVTAAV